MEDSKLIEKVKNASESVMICAYNGGILNKLEKIEMFSLRDTSIDKLLFDSQKYRHANLNCEITIDSVCMEEFIENAFKKAKYGKKITSKKFKKLLMSKRIQRNEAKLLTDMNRTFVGHRGFRLKDVSEILKLQMLLEGEYYADTTN